MIDEVMNDLIKYANNYYADEDSRQQFLLECLEADLRFNVKIDTDLFEFIRKSAHKRMIDYYRSLSRYKEHNSPYSDDLSHELYSGDTPDFRK